MPAVSPQQNATQTLRNIIARAAAGKPLADDANTLQRLLPVLQIDPTSVPDLVAAAKRYAEAEKRQVPTDTMDASINAQQEAFKAISDFEAMVVAERKVLQEKAQRATFNRNGLSQQDLAAKNEMAALRRKHPNLFGEPSA